jgi:hypothetical protein
MYNPKLCGEFSPDVCTFFEVTFLLNVRKRKGAAAETRDSASGLLPETGDSLECLSALCCFSLKWR